MKRILALCMLLVVALPTLGVEGEQVMYVGGTIETLKEGDLGRLDITSQSTLTFEYSGGKAAIPFDKIDSFEYTQQVARHLGVLPAIAVGLVKRRQRSISSASPTTRRRMNRKSRFSKFRSKCHSRS
jgi:hypothetical protein